MGRSGLFLEFREVNRLKEINKVEVRRIIFIMVWLNLDSILSSS